MTREQMIDEAVRIWAHGFGSIQTKDILQSVYLGSSLRKSELVGIRKNFSRISKREHLKTLR
jgi:hypothetical protein